MTLFKHSIRTLTALGFSVALLHAGSPITPPSLNWSTTIDTGATTADRTRAIGMMTNGDVIAATQIGSGTAANIRVQRLASASGSATWTRDIDTAASNEDATDLIVNPSTGDCFVATRFDGGASLLDWYVVKLSGADGSIINSFTFAGPGNDEPRALCFTSDGNVAIAGMSTNATSGQSRARITKINSTTCAEIWTDTRSTDNSDYADVAADSSGNIYACGHLLTAAYLAKYDSSGALLWSQPLNSSSGNSHWSAVTVLSTGAAAVAGTFVEPTGAGNFAAARYGAGGGAATWFRSINGSANGDESAYDIVADASDNVYVAGFQRDSVNGQLATLTKLTAATGVPIWTYTGQSASPDSNANALDAFFSVRLFGTDVIAGGVFTSSTNKADIVIARVATAGGLQEVTTFNGAANNQDLSLTKNLLATNGTNFAIGGDTENATPSSNGIVRSYSLAPPVPAPEIAVTETVAGNVADGGSFGFGTAVVGQAVTKTFTITNSGTANLTLSNLTVPAGFTLAQTFGTTTVAPSGTTTFQISMTTTAPATPSGTLSFDNNDSDENPYNFTISGTVNKANTTVTINTDTPDPSIQAQSVTVTYSVNVTAPGGGTPTGNVVVTDGVDSITGTVAAGQVNLTLNTLGPRTLTATYQGDSNYNASPASNGAGHQVNAPTIIPVSSPAGDVVSGGGAPNGAGAADGTQFDVLKRGGYLAENGNLVFPGTLLVGSGSPPVTLSPNTSMGLWKKGAGNLSLLARSGNIAPEATNATYDILPQTPAINDAGEVTFLASLTNGSGAPATTLNNDTALWSELGATGLGILIREGDTIPGLSPLQVGAFGSGAYATAHTGASTGEATFSITMKNGSTDTAILRTSITGASVTAVGVVARENTPAPGTAETFNNLAGSFSDPQRMDATGNVAFTALIKPSNKEGLWYQPVAGATAKVFVAGDIAPGTSNATFKNIKSPAIGSGGVITFRGLLNNDGDNAAGLRNDGIWRGTGSTSAGYLPILRRGDSGLAGMPGGSKVGNVWHSWLTNLNHGAWRGWLDVNGDGSSAAPADVHAIYTDLSGTMSMIVKVGDQGPGMPAGANFSAIDLPVVGGAEQLAFLGTVTGGGVTAGTNDKGVWRSAPNGGALTLVLRTGDTITTTQGTKTIKSVDFPGSGSTDRRWEQPVMDSTGKLLVFVTFTGLDGTCQVLVP